MFAQVSFLQSYSQKRETRCLTMKILAIIVADMHFVNEMPFMSLMLFKNNANYSNTL